MVARFMAACAQVEVELDSTPRRVDVIREGYDLAIRVRFPPLEDSGLVVRKLATSRQKLVAAPELLARHGQPQTPADLTALPSLGWGAGPAEWHLTGPEGQKATLPHHPRFATDDMGALRQAALDICRPTVPPPGRRAFPSHVPRPVDTSGVRRPRQRGRSIRQ